MRTMNDLMKGKRGLIMGVANDHSIAWGIAKTLAAQGAELAFTFQGEALGKRVKPLAQSLNVELVLPCDVEDIASVDSVFEALRAKWGQLDFLVHAIAFSDKNELKGRYADTTRENFSRTMLISCFSFTELAKRAADLMPASGGAMITLTYGGSTRVMPNYNVMGVAKAALEAYLRDIADSDRSLSRQITELLELIRQYGPDAVAGAIEKAATARAFGADYIANILRQQQCPRREQPPLRLRDPRLNELATDPLSLLAYDAFILQSEKESDDTPGTETPRSESDGHEPPSGDDPL